jgi:hypothetical protein
VSGAREEKGLCRDNLMAKHRMSAALILEVSLFAFWWWRTTLMGLYYPLSTYVQDHLILLTAHILHTHHRGIGSSVAIHTLTSSVLHRRRRQKNIPPTVVPTCDRAGRVRWSEMREARLHGRDARVEVQEVPTAGGTLAVWVVAPSLVQGATPKMTDGVSSVPDGATGTRA